MNLCGGCQVWGYTPRLVDGKCIECNRTKYQILNESGVFEITKQMILDMNLDYSWPNKHHGSEQR